MPTFCASKTASGATWSRGSAALWVLAAGGAGGADRAGQGLGADADPPGRRRLAVPRLRGIESLVVDAHWVNFLLLRLRRAREPSPRTRMIAIRISESPQASVNPSGFASSESMKIFTGTLGNGSSGLK